MPSVPDEFPVSDRPDCLAGSDHVALAAGTRIFQTGDACQQFFFLLSGTVRVDLIGRSGRAILLYRFGAGETCVLTTSCLMSGDDYCAEAHVEEDMRACVIPKAVFHDKLNTSPDFRVLVFASFSERLAAMMGTIENVAFVPIEARLATRVLQLNDSGAAIKTTHHQLAADLGSSREVISRKLAQWEKQGLIRRGRGFFYILNMSALQHLAHMRD